LLVVFAAVFAVLAGNELIERLKNASLPVGAGRVVVVQCGLALALFGYSVQWANPDLDRYRNFYGVFRVVEGDSVRMLVHGSTQHGSQFLDPAVKNITPGLFHKGGALNDGYALRADTGRDIAVIGLGAGVVGGLVYDGDRVDFYEIDPDNERIARRWFTWLDESPGEVRVLVGDGRLKMATQPPDVMYDMVSLDAFSGDSVPTHLLTVEAIGAYLDRLEPDGLMLFHISSRYYDLRPIVKASTAHHGMFVVFSPTIHRDQLGPTDNANIAAMASRNEAALAPLIAQGWSADPPGMPVSMPWTDDYLNLLWPLYWGLDRTGVVE